jgi:5S rRNA maturation endonuclease (ribonuclease M5)
MIIESVLAKLKGAHKTSNGWSAHCPSHNDRNASLCIAQGEDGRVLLKCQAGCDFNAILSALGMKASDLFPPKQPQPITSAKSRKIVATYDYTDAEGKLVFQVVRFDPKDFRQRRPDPAKPGEWLWSMDGVERVLYRLPQIIKAVSEGVTIYVVEGEKDVAALESIGLVATTNSGGAGKWKASYSETLRGAKVVVIADNDVSGVGLQHAAKVRESLEGIASATTIITLPNAKDSADYIALGATREDLEAVVKCGSPVIVPMSACSLNYDPVEIQDDAGKTKTIQVPKPFNEVIDKLVELSQNTLARVDNLMFSKPAYPGGEIIYIQKPAELFGRLGVQNKTIIDWSVQGKAMKQAEAFAEIAPRLLQYRGIETAPHHPPMRGIYYNYQTLPKPDYDSLRILINRFNPETAEDKALILVLFLTSLWGGGEGQRPAFIITSPDGRGSGKSTLPECVAAMLNQDYVASGTKQKISELITRLLSPQGLSSRIVIFDNEVGRVSSGELAGLITSTTISGRRLYEGEGRRPNNMLWCITLNSPTLDSDLASRGIPISVKRPVYTPQWKADTLALLDSNRWGIIAALMDILATPTATIESRTRWGAWENEVLGKLPADYADGVDGIQGVIVERQKSFDDEADEVSLIRDGFSEAIQHSNINPRINPCFFTNSTAAAIYNEATGAHVRKNTALRHIKDLIRSESLPNLSESRQGAYGRGFLWLDSQTIAEQEIRLVSVVAGQ